MKKGTQMAEEKEQRAEAIEALQNANKKIEKIMDIENKIKEVSKKN